MSAPTVIDIRTLEDWPRMEVALQSAKRIAVDLEFDRNRLRYGFQICLMQVQIGEETFLVDPLSEDNLHTKVFPYIEDPNLEKVVFSFNEDLSLFHYLGCEPKGLFDIGVAIRLIDRGQASLAKVIEEFLGREVSKESQTSDWFRRPLSDAQRLYAAEDVSHLFDLQEEVIKEATERGVIHWIAEENRFLEEKVIPVEDEDYFIRDKDRHGLDEVQWHVYVALLRLREEWAEAKDAPSYRIMSYDQVKQLACDGLPRDWQKEWKIHPAYRRPQYYKQMREVHRDALEEAKELGLSKDKSARKAKGAW